MNLFIKSQTEIKKHVIIGKWGEDGHLTEPANCALTNVFNRTKIIFRSYVSASRWGENNKSPTPKR